MKTSRENKRLLSWILSLALVFSVLGVSAGTAEAETTGVESTGIAAQAASGPAVTSFTGKIRFSPNGTVTQPVTGGAVEVTINGGAQRGTVTPNSSGEFTYNASPSIAAGECEIEVEWNNRIVTKTVNLTTQMNTYETNPSLIFTASGKEHTLINEKTNIGAIVDDVSMVKQFYATPATNNEHGITQEDLNKAAAGTHNLFLYMQVYAYDPDRTSDFQEITTAHKTAIQTRASSDGNSILDYYSVYMYKRAQATGGGAVGSTPTLTRSNDLIKIQIPLKDSALDRSNYIVYRHHEGNVETVDTTANGQGEYIEVDQEKKMLTLHVKNYCLYVLAADPAAPTPTPTVPSGPIWYPEPVATQTAAPTAEPTEEPQVTAEPTVEPTAEPTKEPEATVVPTVEPTQEPQATVEPTAKPEKVVVKKMLLEATKIKSTSTKLVWDKLPDADGYDLYQSKCNTNTKTYKVKYAKTFKSGEKHTYALKGLKKGKWYKNRIYAWKMVDGKKVIIGKSLIVHHYHKKKNDKSKWGNPTGIKLSKKKLSVAKGKTAKLSAKALASGKDMGRHGKRIRYVVSDTAIASVSANGKVKGKKKGTCTVYVVAQSGLKKKVKVTVK